MKKIIIKEEEIEKNVLAIYKCPKCKKLIKGKINWNEDYYKKAEDFKSGHIHICSCVSGGVYDVYFECPYCNEQVSFEKC